MIIFLSHFSPFSYQASIRQLSFTILNFIQGKVARVCETHCFTKLVPDSKDFSGYISLIASNANSSLIQIYFTTSQEVMFDPFFQQLFFSFNLFYMFRFFVHIHKEYIFFATSSIRHILKCIQLKTHK
jgi:hypothetical protein